MAKIFIEGVAHEVDPAKNLLEASLELGLDLPYFCWHPALGSVGACRQCAVKQYRDEKDTQGKIVMACMTPAAEGTRISVKDDEARLFRKSITELLMVNHPHDCPVCDEGGECHLQDMTVMTGHRVRAYRFEKKTYENQNLGPFVNHEMNRCIQCYRCVHFYREHAGGKDLAAFAAHDHVYFGRARDGVLESEFSGNLVEVCPTGVFTDKTLKRHYTRKWDLQTAPSVCVHCSVGCNTIPGERYGKLRRIRNRYHGAVNGYFLCDRGRFGYDFVNDERRVRRPRVRKGETALWTETDHETAVRRVAELLRGGRAIGIGSPRASMEANLALRALVTPQRFFQGVSRRDAALASAAVRILAEGPSRTPSLREIEACDAVLVLGEDVSNTAPLVDLAIRQAAKRAPEAVAEKLKIPRWNAAAIRTLVQERKGPVYVATPAATRLDPIATRAFRGAPEDIARLGGAVARALDPAAPEVTGLSAETAALAAEIAGALRAAKRPVIVTGTGLRNEAVLAAGASVAWAAGAARATGPAELCCVVPECNSLGLALFDAPALEDAFAAVSGGSADVVVVLENDLFRRAGAADVERFLSSAKHVVVLDHLITPTAERAEVVLSVGTFAEADGTLVSHEGRAQRFYQVFVPETDILESWRWLRDVARAGAGDAALGGWERLDDATAAVAAALPRCREIAKAAPPADLRIHGEKIPRETHRYSGRTAMNAHLSMHEPKPPTDPDSPLSFSMEGFEGQAPAAVTANFWAPGWNSIQSLNRFQEEVGGHLRGGDSGVRLLEPTSGARPRYAAAPAEPFRRRDGEWLLVPLVHTFGSEELSALSAGVAALSPGAYVALSAEDAAALAASGGNGEAAVTCGDVVARLPVRVAEGLPRGVAGLPLGMSGVPVVDLPSWGRIAK
ncbi:MAG: NADH-quinone oxidoreductase subunit NuoG [bacterium]